MKISSDNILVRLYNFNFRVLSEYHPYPRNLCHFMRVIFFWLPLKILFAIFLLSGTAWIVFILPIMEWGILLYLTFAGLVLSSIYLVFRLCTHPWGPAKERVAQSETIQIISTYYKAVKQKVCPLIEIVDKEG